MRLRAPQWMMATGFMVLYGCALFQAAPSVIYRDDSLTVRLEPNPDGGGQGQGNGSAQALTAQDLEALLRGLYARPKEGLLQSLFDSRGEQVFREEELSLVARELHNGLKQAAPQDRVAFQLWRPRGRGREETSGSIYLRGSLLYVTLVKFHSLDAVTYKDAEFGSGTDFDLLFEPSESVVLRPQGFAGRWLAADRPEVIIDVQRFRKTSVP